MLRRDIAKHTGAAGLEAHQNLRLVGVVPTHRGVVDVGAREHDLLVEEHRLGRAIIAAIPGQEANDLTGLQLAGVHQPLVEHVDVLEGLRRQLALSLGDGSNDGVDLGLVVFMDQAELQDRLSADGVDGLERRPHRAARC